MSEEQIENEAAAKLVKQRDRDRYMSTLFAPAKLRADLVALYAFNAELVRIPATVSDPMPGEIRLQWWRDAITFAELGQKTGKPSADALRRTVWRHNLAKDDLIRMIDARAADLYAEPFADMAALKLYIHETSSLVFELATVILGAGNAHKEIAEAAGLAYGFTLVLRTLPQQAGRFRAFPPEALRMEAVNALARFLALTKALDKSMWPAFLPVALVPAYLKLMAAPGYNLAGKAATLNPLTRFWRIWRAAIAGKI